ncbi:MAG: DNA polymerase V [Gammaproteobacteria bacterium]|nr:MAG: DNA polymerase V [Gammaproteobacteria bacterium]RLA52806.1 MAG: DNA polymerase V [Gammaproteobacteria bacterium]
MSDNQQPKSRGGARLGAGRKKGSSAYGEPTKAIRVPESMVPELLSVLEQRKQQVDLQTNRVLPSSFIHPTLDPLRVSIPLFNCRVAAGFPSPADDYIEQTLDLNQLLIQKPAATFFVRAEGDSMIGAGIHSNDILVVDRSIEAVPGKVVICALNDELTVKRLARKQGQLVLMAENSDYPDIPIQDEVELVIWGVVTNVIHAL